MPTATSDRETLMTLGEWAEARRLLLDELLSDPADHWLVAQVGATHYEQTADDDPCWESRAWTRSLKADCLFRAAVCSRHLGRPASARRLLRGYVDQVLAGTEASYSLDEVSREVRELGDAGGRRRARSAIDALLGDPSLRSAEGPPRPDLSDLTAA